MSDLPATARRVAALKVFEAAVNGEKEGAREALLDELLALGVERLRITMPDGTPLGLAVLSGGKETAKVVDEQAFLAWVRKNAPQELVETVRDSYRKSVLKRVKSGEEVPDGVELGETALGTTVTLAEGASEVVLTALRSGLIEPLALPGGES